MTRTILIFILLVTATSAYAQEIKMDEEAKKSYVTKERTRALLSRAKTLDNTDLEEVKDAPPAYAALDLIRLSDDETLRVIFDPGAVVRRASHMSEDLKKVERLEEVIGQFTSDVDVLNYLSNLGWEVVSVTRSPLENPQKGERTRVYISKILRE